MIVFALVAFNGKILAKYASVTGNFDDIAKELLLKQSSQSRMEAGVSRVSVHDESSGFNFHIDFKGPDSAYCFMCLASDDEGRATPFRMLDELAQEFFLRYGNDHSKDRALSLNNDLGPVIKRLLKKYSAATQGESESASQGGKKSGGMENIKNLKSELENVKGSVQKNISQIVENGAQLDSLAIQTESLLDTSAAFKQNATQLERTKRWESLKFKILAAVGLLVLFYILLSRVCGGFSLSSCI